jgi:4-amino-4-deoxy-L-arabinose transferase-like glycosyltransferase
MMRNHRAAIGLLLASLCIRGLVLVTNSDDLHLDNDAYARLAVNWSTSGTFGHESIDGTVTPTAYRPPLYPWILSLFVFDRRMSIVGVAMLHAALGSATVLLTWAIGVRVNLHRPWIAGLMVAMDPILIRQSQLVMTETLATFLAALAWWIWLIVYPFTSNQTCTSKHRNRSQWIALVSFGTVIGLSLLARPTAAPWAVLCIGGMLFIGCSCWKRRVNDCLLTSVIILCVVMPWVLRNIATLGHPIWATTHGGYTLLLANNPSLYSHFGKNGPSRNWDTSSFDSAWAVRHSLPPNSVPPPSGFWLQMHVKDASDLTPFDEVADDQFAYRAAIDTIQSAPAQFWVSCLYRAGWLWALWPNAGSPKTVMVIGGWYTATFALALIGFGWIIRSGGYRGWLVGFALILSLTAVHSVYWSNMRMRSPATPCVVLLAMIGVQVVQRQYAPSKQA